MRIPGSSESKRACKRQYVMRTPPIISHNRTEDRMGQIRSVCDGGEINRGRTRFFSTVMICALAQVAHRWRTAVTEAETRLFTDGWCSTWMVGSLKRSSDMSISQQTISLTTVNCCGWGEFVGNRHARPGQGNHAGLTGIKSPAKKRSMGPNGA